ncbi:MAG: efflux RND transporter periplasmic adaptor subunit [Desulfopila sp.]|jgi:membrane fusion protein (multidrug efflux system)|nr:efflux RND transporter periplasmic adaptor subunit [Desulfopila sp.]
MDPQDIQPTTRRAKTVFYIWSTLPRLILLAMIVLIVVLAMGIMKKHDSIAADKAAGVIIERPPVNAVVYPLTPSTVRDKINLPGSIEPWNSLELTAKISGAIVEVPAKEGDEVKAGDILARIEEDDYRIALQRAEARYRLAKANFERDKAVFSKGVIPVAELEAKETNLLTARADLDNARLQLNRCTIKAPIDGVVRRLDVKVGLFLSVADPVGQLLQIDKVKAVVGIPESDIAAVRKIDTIDVSLQALNDMVVTGSKHFLSPAPDTTARLYKMELQLDNESRSILPGMFVRAEIVKRSVANAIAIPFYSVISRNDEQFVFVEEDGVAHKRPVKLGIMENWMVEVTSGLSPRDNLVIEGHRDMEEGREINVVKILSTLDEYRL